ncbi:hypothetical protein AN1V17_06010 [Vallitalea sediminicola]
MRMKKIINSKQLNNLMTLATDLNYNFFNDTILYKGLNCLFSVAVVKEEIPFLNLRKEQIVVTSPIINNQENNDSYTIYTTIDMDIESGLLIPIISWALEFTKQILMLDMSVYMEKIHGIVERILLQVWEYEEVNQSEEGLNIDLLNPVSWESIIEGRIRLDNYDSLVQAETLLKNGVIGVEEILLPHVHQENIDYFRRAGVSGEVIFDW